MSVSAVARVGARNCEFFTISSGYSTIIKKHIQYFNKCKNLVIATHLKATQHYQKKASHSITYYWVTKRRRDLPKKSKGFGWTLVLSVIVGCLSFTEDKEEKEEKEEKDGQTHHTIPTSKTAQEEQEPTHTTFLQRLYFYAQCFFRAVLIVVLFFPLMYFFPILYVPRMSQLWWKYLRFTLETLGASWIKLGQWASTRRDIFPVEFIDYISKLCYRCPAHDFAYTQKLIETTYAKKMEDLFVYFERVPLASGAIGQVYRARLREGKQIVVKVLHPTVEATLDVDLALMAFFAHVIEMLPGMKWLSLCDAIAQFSISMKAQSDFQIEANNLKTFQEHFKGHPDVVFPSLVEALPATRGVLAETFEEGEVLQNSKYLRAVSPESVKLAKIGLDAYLKMMLLDNFVHADLHPGNILVRKNEKGKLGLVFLDVGLVSHLSPSDFEHFKLLFKAIVQREGKHGAKLMVQFAKDHNLTPEEEERFVNDMDAIFQDVRSKKMSEIRVGEFLSAVLDTVRMNHVKIEGNFSTLCVGTVVLEGIGRQLDPELNILDASLPILVQGDVIPEDNAFKRRALWEKLKYTFGFK